jgi:hypothetical protein
MSESNEGDGLLRVDDSLVTIFTREQRVATFMLGLLLAGREGAVAEGASEAQLANLDEGIQWLNEKVRG